MKKFSFWSLLTIVFFASTLGFVSCSDDDNDNDKSEDTEHTTGGGTQGGNNSTNKTFTVNGVQFTMVAVDGGTFQMGSNDGRDNQKPVHSVTLSSYYIGQTEVTQALWKAVTGSGSSWSYFEGDNLPVESVTCNDCQYFINKLNQLTGERFRLPTEAEWEFAARGGNKSRGYIYSGSDNIDDVAWHTGNSGKKTHPVGTKAPNELGIYDMSGNVWEWCQDWYGSYSNSAQTNPTGPASGYASGYARMFRGGCYRFCVSTVFRNYYDFQAANIDLGFRLALSK